MRFRDLNGYEQTIKLHNKPRMNRSKLHTLALDILEEMFPFDRIYNEIYAFGLYLDIFIPSLKLVIEVHGQQHFKRNTFHHPSKKDFINAQNNDKTKKQWCDLNGLTLVELNFDDVDNWKERIENR